MTILRKPPLTTSNWYNNLINHLLKGELPLTEATDEAIQSWLSAFQQTAGSTTLPRIDGAILVAEFQAAFKAVKECTTPPIELALLQLGSGSLRG